MIETAIVSALPAVVALEGEGAGISDVLSNWTTLVTGVMSIVTGNPIIFTMFAIGLVGGAIGLVKRFM